MPNDSIKKKDTVESSANGVLRDEKVVVPETLLVYPALISLPLLMLAPRINTLMGPEPLVSIRPFCQYAGEVHIASFGFVAILLGRYSYSLRHDEAWKLSKQFRRSPLDLIGDYWPALAFVLGIVIMYLMDDILAQLAFSQPLSSAPLDSGLITFFKERVRAALFGSESQLLSRMPSGFALRQWLFFLTAWLALAHVRSSSSHKNSSRESEIEFGRERQDKENEKNDRKLGIRAKVGIWAYFLMFLYIAVARVSVGAHLPIDVIVSMSVGTLLFMFILAVLAFVKQAGDLKLILEYFVAYGFVAVVMFILLSANPVFWIGAVAVVGSVVVVLSHKLERGANVRGA